MELNQLTHGTLGTQLNENTVAIWDRATETCTIKRNGLIIITKKIRKTDSVQKLYDYIQGYKLNK